jgi:MFS family permease
MTVYLKTNYVAAYTILMLAIVFRDTAFIFFGWLSDRVGRKPIILGGCLLAAVTYADLPDHDCQRQPDLRRRGQDHGANPNILPMTVLVWIQIIYVTMVYGPIAAFLVEYFPARARYTQLSIPYHLGNGEFGGWLPFIYTAIVAATVAGPGFQSFFGLNLQFLNPSGDPNGNILAGLIYAIAISIMTAVIGWFFIPETNKRKIWEEVGGEHAVGVTS